MDSDQEDQDDGRGICPEPARSARPAPPAAILGQAAIVRMAYENRDTTALVAQCLARAQATPPDAGAMLDLAMILQCRGGRSAQDGLTVQAGAVALQPSYRVSHGTGRGLRVLAFVTPGDFMANTPVDFLLEGSDAVLILHFVTAETTSLAGLPAHDVAVLAIGESPANRAVLATMARLLADWPGPILNNAARTIANLTRDGVSASLAGQPGILAPPSHRLSRRALAAIAGGGDPPPPCPSFPLVVRPVASHAGKGMARLADRAALADWLSRTPADEAYIAPYIDYRGADGLFAKQRVVLIGGRPHAGHMAVSDHWMVHYLNARMDEFPDRRAAEARWMASFDTEFVPRHARAFAALHRTFGLDYFGIDCAEMPDGRLLVFEVDVAMIVHDMDDARLFPYKAPAMRRLLGAFTAALEAATAR